MCHHSKVNDELLRLIETRIEGLKIIFGSTGNNVNEENFAESLLSANSMISNTMSGHEQIEKASTRSEEIENYLDVDSIDKQENAKIKQIFIKSIAPTLAATNDMLKKVKELEKTVGAEYFANLPDITNKLDTFNKQLQEAKQSNDLIEESLILAMQHYSSTQKNTTTFLTKLNNNMLELEENI